MLLPEYFAMMGQTDQDKLAIQETFGAGAIQDFLAAAAREHGIYLVAGTIALRSEHAAKVKNSCLVFDPLARVLRATTKFIYLVLIVVPSSFVKATPLAQAMQWSRLTRHLAA
nr:nitrilase-related carbon-nitrogen hydrolase [Deefgea sp. CFH1-16]